MSEFDALRADDVDLAGLRTAVRAFLTADRETFGWTPAVDCWLSSWDTDFSIRLAEAGFIGLTIPVEYGGRAPADGTGYLHRYVVTEELLAARRAGGGALDRRPPGGPRAAGVRDRGTAAASAPQIAAGRLYSAIGMSEHGAGSDLAAVPRGRRATDDGWVLNGTKVWTSGAHLAHQIVVLARTSPLDPDHRHAGFSQFIVPTDLPGITISPIVLMNGEHHFNEVQFDDVRLTDGDVLGEIGAGWHQVTSELGFERSGPERFLSTATLLLDVITALGRTGRRRPDRGRGRRPDGAHDLAATVVGGGGPGADLGRGCQHPGGMVKDLGTRFEQDSVELAADLVDGSAVPTGCGCVRCWPSRGCTHPCSRCAAEPTRCYAASWLEEPRRRRERRTQGARRGDRPPIP